MLDAILNRWATGILLSTTLWWACVTHTWTDPTACAAAAAAAMGWSHAVQASRRRMEGSPCAS